MFVQRLAMGCFALIACGSAYGDVIDIDTSEGSGQVGGYYGPYDPDHDPPASYPSTLAPDNKFDFQNYFMGRTTESPLASSIATPERRSFFIFDTSALSIPDGHEITGVSIELELVSGGVIANFATGSEIVEFSSTPHTAAEILDPDGASISYDTIWSTFGSSTPYGGFEIMDASSATPTTPGPYTIGLPGAIGDVTDAITSGSEFTVTAKLATFDPGPIGAGAGDPAVPPTDPYEFVFGLTDVVGGSSPFPAPTLYITTTAVPEPGTALMMPLASLLVLRRRRARRMAN